MSSVVSDPGGKREVASPVKVKTIKVAYRIRHPLKEIDGQGTLVAINDLPAIIHLDKQCPNKTIASRETP